MSDPHFGPPNKGEPFIDPEVWRKAVSLVTRYRPSMQYAPFKTHVKHWRHEIPKIDGYHQFDTNTIRNAVMRKYYKQAHFAHGRHFWRIADIICENVQVYVSGKEAFFEHIVSPDPDSADILSNQNVEIWSSMDEYQIAY